MQIKLILPIIIFSLFSSSAFTKECYTLSPKNTELKWTAYKTPAKAGVGGTFKGIRLTGPLKGKSIAEIVETTNFTIDAKTVYTKNPDRDKKLFKNIFSTIVGQKIEGKFSKMAKGELLATITMNGVTREVPLSFKENKDTISATGYIDLFDFTMGDQLKAINKACYALHEGKTWSDVQLTVLAKFESCKK